MNSVQLIGRLTQDPVGDRLSDGTAVATFRLAVDHLVSEKADFVTIKVWSRTADAVVEHLSRGRRVAVQGRLSHHEWTDADGGRASRLIVVAHWVEFLDSPNTAVRGEDDRLPVGARRG